MRQSIFYLYEKAYGKYGIGAFNVFNAEQLHGVFRGAEKADSPIIVQFTPVARNYVHPVMLNEMVNAATKIYPRVDFVVHLDHGNYDHCIDAIDSGGYDSVMIDASHEPFEENVRITKKVVDRAHARDIAVEAELGVLSGIEDSLSVDEQKSYCTDPLLAKEFVARTGCDSLAVAVGTSHGAYKFGNGAKLQLNVLSEIQKQLPHYPLVLHGASAVPEEEVMRINRAGGQLKEGAKGIAADDLMQAIRLGVCKINIATDMRLIWTRVHREFFLSDPGKFDPIVPGKTYMDELERFVANKCLFLKGKIKI
ncbi:MAG TPA: class II fructose-bisphosphate aldolase [Prolixibacteraceae bacterium]|nr:class II fructose-bisphosphate aldolase [Prolixibacteraceae bacterium]HPS12754.1 class II fructose-bisphosphate aldolase [Prolixibacteraceae bacterium]